VKFSVLGSGSRGNAIAIRAEGVTLLLDAGFGPRTLAKRAHAAGLLLSPLAGIALTHEHGDHARGAAALARREGCPVIASPGTLASFSGFPDVSTVELEPHRATSVGPFSITAARASHDAREPLALAVTGPCGRKIGLAYDLGRVTASVRYLLQDCAALIVEANHDEVLLRTGPYPATVRHRISGSGGHLSNRAAADLLAEVCGAQLETVVLVHVSERCNRPDLARRTASGVLRACGFKGSLLVADQDRPLPAMSVPSVGQLSFSLR
jgi:phosphoribosyl 1,2-cyclic phosphodiesterase